MMTKNTTDSLSEKIKILLTYLNQNLYGKEEAIRLAILSAIANESIFFMGPPGTAKSMISRRIAAAFKDFYKDDKFSTDGSGYFEYLMNEFSTPDEICGPVELSALNEKPSRYVRQTEGYLPSANVAFLDEIWKSGPAILNTLLTIINEKKYHNGNKVEKVPLVSLASASNELPPTDKGLLALWDRFILRVFVNPVVNEDDFFKLVDDGNKDLVLKDEYKAALLEIGDVEKWQAEIDKIELSAEARNIITAIRKELTILNKDENHKEEEGENYYVSDRRWKKIVHILKTSAFLNGRKSVDLMDCSLIEYAIWNTDKQHKELSGPEGIIKKILKQNGFRFDEEIQKVEDYINKFDKYVTSTFYIKEPDVEELVIEKMNDGEEAYELKKTCPLNIKKNYHSEPVTVKYISRSRKYYDSSKNELCSNACSDISIDESMKIISWKNNNGNRPHTTDVAFTIHKGKKIIKNPEVFDNADVFTHRQDIADSDYYEKISSLIQNLKNELQSTMSCKEKDFKENQFANQEYLNVIMSPLKETKKNLEDLKVELNKIRHRYTD